MTLVPVFCVILLSAGCGFFESPQNQVKGFISAVESQDFDRAMEYISPGLRDKMSEVVSDFTTQGSSWAASGYDIKNVTTDGEQSEVTVDFIDGGGSATQNPVEFGSRRMLRFFMIKEDGHWYIEAISQ